MAGRLHPLASIVRRVRNTLATPRQDVWIRNRWHRPGYYTHHL